MDRSQPDPDGLPLYLLVQSKTVERETRRLILREMTEADTTAYSLYLESNFAYFVPWTPERTKDYYNEANVRQVIASRMDLAAAKAAFTFGLFRKSDLRLIGTAGITNIVYGVFQSCNLGYELSQDAVGNGYMTEALQAVVEFCFAELRLHRIEANVMPRNDRSKSVLKRLGFENEGLSRKYLRINGSWEDHEHYVMLNSAAE